MGVSLNFGQNFHPVKVTVPEDDEYGDGIWQWVDDSPRGVSRNKVIRDFPRSLDGLDLKGFQVDKVYGGGVYYQYDDSRYAGGSVSFSYPGYNAFRENLTYMAVGLWKRTTDVKITPREIWHTINQSTGFFNDGSLEDPYETIPFLDLINFSDAEGVIGPVAFQRLFEWLFKARITRWPGADHSCEEELRLNLGERSPGYSVTGTMLANYDAIAANITRLGIARNPCIGFG